MAVQRGCSERLKMILSSSPVISLRMGADGSSTARDLLTRPPTGTPRRAMSSGEAFPLHFSLGSGQGCPLLRASNEHSFTVRVLRARRAPGRSLLPPLEPLPTLSPY